MKDELTYLSAKARTRVVLQIGAHKTASTHFERTIRTSRRLIEAFDLAAPTKFEVRKALTQRIPKVRPAVPLSMENCGVSTELLGERNMLFLPDENVLGTPRRAFDKGQFYPRAERRFRRALHLLEDCDVEVMMALRHPGSFAISNYGETLRFNGYLPFRTYLGEMAINAMYWARLVRRLARAAQGRRFTVWCFEDYHRLLPELVNRVVGCGAGRRPEHRRISRVVRPGLSARALAEIEALDDPASLPPGEIEQIMERYPKSEEWPAPELFTEIEQKKLDVAYAIDRKQLRTAEGVTFLE